MPIFGDEAYYYVWSLRPQLSYFDHPGMVSWLIYLSDHIFPAASPLGLRFSFILLSLFTSFIWLRILQEREFSEKQITIFFSLMFLNPLLGIGSIVATPDVPLVFFWSLSYLFFSRLLKNKNLGAYIGLGISLGLGFCSKYHIVLFVLSGLVALVFEKKWRQLRIPGVLLTLVSGLIFSLPVLIWNSRNQWSSFLFQINHGFGDDGFDLSWPLNYIFTQIMIMSPFLFYLLLMKIRSGDERWFGWSQLAFFLTSSFKSIVEGNWPITSHLHIMAATVPSVSGKIFRYILVNWLILYGIIIVFLLLPTSEKVRRNLINSAQLSDIYPLMSQYQPLYGASYQVASLLSWKTNSFVPKLNELSRTDFFDSLPESTPAERDFYALKYDYSAWPAKYDHYKKTYVRSFDKAGLELYHFTYE